MKFKITFIRQWHMRYWPILAVMFAMGCMTGTLESNTRSKTLEANAIQRGPLPTFLEKTAGIERHDGFFPFYYDVETEKLYLEIDRIEEEFLYLNSLSAGWVSAGMWWDSWPWSNSEAALVHCERHGARIFLISYNKNFRCFWHAFLPPC